jgi:hypothetical protein
MQTVRREALVELGAETLADAFLELAARSEVVENWVVRNTSSGEENLARFRSGLRALTRGGEFFGAWESQALASRIAEILADIEAADVEPRQGLEAVFALFRSDGRILESCDDSYEYVTQAFVDDAAEVFARLAARRGDDAWLSDRLIELCLEDEYGLRSSLFDHVGNCLSEAGLQAMLDRLWELADGEATDSDRRYWLDAIGRIARGTGNAPLFERARRALTFDLSPPDILDVADFYHKTGDSARALVLLHNPSDWHSTLAASRDHLLVEIHRTLGNREDLAGVARRIFHRHRSEETLATLLEAIGEKERERVVVEEAEKILAEPRLSNSDATFLVSAGRLAEAERYVLERSDQLDGSWFYTLVPLAGRFEAAGHPLAATITYRSLLASILERGVSKAYHHGARYLHRLNALAEGIRDWKGFTPHPAYFAELRSVHGRKWSFWKQYGE